MRLSEWARRLGDFLGIEPEEDKHPARASEEDPDEPDAEPLPEAEPAAEAPPVEAAPAKRRIKAVQGPGSDEELADLRSIVEELQEHVDADPDE